MNDSMTYDMLHVHKFSDFDAGSLLTKAYCTLMTVRPRILETWTEVTNPRCLTGMESVTLVANLSFITDLPDWFATCPSKQSLD